MLLSRSLTALVVLISLALMAGACGGDTSSDGPVTTTEATPDARWTRLPDPPLAGRTAAAVASVEGRLVVAGGWSFTCPGDADCELPSEPPFSDGATFDFGTNEWLSIADAPVGFRNSAVTVVGPDLYALSQCDTSTSCPAGRTMLRYRSHVDEWDLLPAPADHGQFRLLAVAGQLVAYAESDENGESPDYRFILSEQRWLALPDDPLPPVYDRQLVGYDGKLLLFGTPIDPSSRSTKLAAEFEPNADTWTELAESETKGFQVWRGGQLLYLNPHFPGADGGVFNPSTNSWMPLPDPPITESWQGDMAGILTDDHGIYEHVSGWVLNARSLEWVEVLPRPTAKNVFDETITAVGAQMIVFGGRSGGDTGGNPLNETWVWNPFDVG